MASLVFKDRSGLNVGVPEMKAPLCGESSPSSASSDEVAILPRQTKVIVIGNNRTKVRQGQTACPWAKPISAPEALTLCLLHLQRALIGQTAVVKKAVGLGGWHFLVRGRNQSALAFGTTCLPPQFPTLLMRA